MRQADSAMRFSGLADRTASLEPELSGSTGNLNAVPMPS